MQRPQEPGLTAIEVARLLQVKRETVYAYVSRGLLHRRLSIDGRTSLFDPAEVDRLRQGRRPDSNGELRATLATRITRVDDDGLLIRGHELIGLVEGGASFIDVVELLWDTSPPPVESDLPRPASGERTSATVSLWRRAHDDLKLGWSGSPSVEVELEYGMGTQPERLLDRLRIVAAVVGSADPHRHDLQPQAVQRAGRRLILALSGGLDAGSVGQSVASMLWRQLGGAPQPTAEQLRAVDIALALLADHGLAASTMAARVAASVRADPYSVVGAGLGALGGPLHGGASGAVHQLCQQAVEGHGGLAAAVDSLSSRNTNSASPPGFGHAVYRGQDPRYGLLFTQLVRAWPGSQRLSTVFLLREQLGQRTDRLPNIDLGLGTLTFLAGMNPGAGEAIFAVARTAGWLAHAMEEYDERALRFRPRARYIGETSPRLPA